MIIAILSKEYFAEIRKKTIYLKLGSICLSDSYIDEIHYTERILNEVENGWKQISVRFVQSYPRPIPPSIPIHKITFEEACTLGLTFEEISHIECVHISYGFQGTSIPPIPKVKELTLLSGQGIEDVSNLSHLHRLKLLPARNVVDISSLKNIPDLTLEDCPNVKDFSMFNNLKQKHLSLSRCPFLCNVNNFQGIHKLQLKDCFNIINVSPLYGIYDLSIEGCLKIQDISGLGKHHRLKIVMDYDTKLKGYEAFLGIPHVSIGYCEMPDLTVLRDAKTVYLSHLWGVKDLTPLKDAQEVWFHNYVSGSLNYNVLKDVSKLHLLNNMHVNIDVIEFKNQNLEISGYCQGSFTNDSFLKNVKCFTAFNFAPISQLVKDGNVSYVQNLYELTIHMNWTLTHVNGLGNIPVVRLVHCYELVDISGLGNNRCVEIRRCKKVRDASSLACVPIVTIDAATLSDGGECLRKVQRLKFTHY